MKRTSPRLIASLSALALTAVACSGSLPDWHYGRAGGDTSVTIAEPGSPEAGVPTGAGIPSIVPGASGGPLPTVGPSGGGGPVPTGGGTPVPTKTGSAGRYVAHIWSGSADTTGIYPDRIQMCGHAALLLAAAFDTNPEDLNVYWEQVNDSSEKVHGRTVNITWKDDQYKGTTARDKVQECVAEKPFMILGGIGFDQVPFAREEAEKNKTLYIHHMAIAQGIERATYSFSLQPTVEEVGRAFGEHIAAKYSSKSVGIIYRDSEYWKPGRVTGRKVLDQRKVRVVDDLPVEKDQHYYGDELRRLQDDDVKVVWIWENALVAAEIIQQASQQGYRPQWVVFPFQTTLDVIGKEKALSPPMDGVGTWAAYKPGGFGDDFSAYGYTAEIKRFEAAYKRYRPNTKLNDILWQTWIGNKTLHQLLLRCGRDCTRNKIAGEFLGGLKTRVDPNCDLDFTHPLSYRGRIGLHKFVVLQTIANGSAAAWKTVAWCREHLG